jgi:hypothetical protein
VHLFERGKRIFLSLFFFRENRFGIYFLCCCYGDAKNIVLVMISQKGNGKLKLRNEAKKRADENTIGAGCSHFSG